MIEKIVVVPRLIIEYCINDDSISYWENWSLISISTTEEQIVADKENLMHKGCNDFLECVFADVTKKEYDNSKGLIDAILFSKETAQRIIGYIEKIKDTSDILVVHCDAGISRSGAVGLFACRYLGLDESKFRKENNVLPNIYVMDVLNEVSGRKDDYQAFWERKLNDEITKRIRFKD